jgi:hypothetical protein
MTLFKEIRINRAVAMLQHSWAAPLREDRSIGVM